MIDLSGLTGESLNSFLATAREYTIFAYVEVVRVYLKCIHAAVEPDNSNKYGSIIIIIIISFRLLVFNVIILNCLQC